MNEATFIEAISANPINRALLDGLAETGLNDVWLVSGGLFQTVWNEKTGRAPQFGIKDYDIFYFDDTDLSWDAEDAAITRAQETYTALDARIEIRNQARVHLWYEEKFGLPYTPLGRTTDGIDRFLATACMVGISRDGDGNLRVYAPSGFSDLSNLVVRPNKLAHFDETTYRVKADRWQRHWPELQILTPE